MTFGRDETQMASLDVQPTEDWGTKEPVNLTVPCNCSTTLISGPKRWRAHSPLSITPQTSVSKFEHHHPHTFPQWRRHQPPLQSRYGSTGWADTKSHHPVWACACFDDDNTHAQTQSQWIGASVVLHPFVPCGKVLPLQCSIDGNMVLHTWIPGSLGPGPRTSIVPF